MSLQQTTPMHGLPKQNTAMPSMPPIIKSEAVSLLARRTPAEDALLFEKARHARNQYTGSKLFVYGFIYISTYCRNACTFCFYNTHNEHSTRYRKSLAESLEIGKRLADDGVHLLDITLGEDPYFLAEQGFNELLELIAKLHHNTKCSIMVSPGVLPKPYYALLRQAGADWYACYQENHRRDVFACLRPKQDFDTRMQARVWAKEAGLLVEDGLLTGVGESLESLEYSLGEIHKAAPHQARIMGYVAHENTLPSQQHDDALEFRAMALLRLANPQLLIPASLDIDGLQGLESRLHAGANVITSIVPAGYGLTGVASGDYDIENKRRSVTAVRHLVESLGLGLADASSYTDWVTRQRMLDMETMPQATLPENTTKATLPENTTKATLSENTTKATLPENTTKATLSGAFLPTSTEVHPCV